MDNDTKVVIAAGRWIAVVLFIMFLFYVSSFFWGPQYRVWQQGMEGKAELMKAEYTRQTKVIEAKANLESQRLNAEAEIARSKGVAQSNEIVKGTITDQYIRYLWVQTLDREGAQNQIIYVPTELGLPITEAGRATVEAPTKK